MSQKKFKLNTATAPAGRIKGWRRTKSELEKTIEAASRADRPELIQAIVAEIAASEKKLAVEDSKLNRFKRGTRDGRAAGARYNRAWDKLSALKNALTKLTSETEQNEYEPTSADRTKPENAVGIAHNNPANSAGGATI